ncbi:MAG: radical SAM protein [Candidatus Cloacimonetes bacterium]|nr:radical SAM protein [Candidatus Cloacimonadota bacterium]
MQISEIFFSIQGESVYSGLPTVFIRTSGCNLNCNYCDTGYSLNSNSKIFVKNVSMKSIIEKINKFPHTNLVQITGGEPLLQEDIYDLMFLLHDNNFKILLETNGSIDISHVPDFVCKIVDIKTPSSGHPESFLLTNLKYINPVKDNLKFVLSDMKDYKWFKDFIIKYQLFGNHVLVSTAFSQITPEKITKKILKDGLDVRFQLQIHKYIGIK